MSAAVQGSLPDASRAARHAAASIGALVSELPSLLDIAVASLPPPMEPVDPPSPDSLELPVEVPPSPPLPPVGVVASAPLPPVPGEFVPPPLPEEDC